MFVIAGVVVLLATTFIELVVLAAVWGGKLNRFPLVALPTKNYDGLSRWFWCWRWNWGYGPDTVLVETADY